MGILTTRPLSSCPFTTPKPKISSLLRKNCNEPHLLSDSGFQELITKFMIYFGQVSILSFRQGALFLVTLKPYQSLQSLAGRTLYSPSTKGMGKWLNKGKTLFCVLKYNSKRIKQKRDYKGVY